MAGPPRGFILALQNAHFLKVRVSNFHVLLLLFLVLWDFFVVFVFLVIQFLLLVCYLIIHHQDFWPFLIFFNSVNELSFLHTSLIRTLSFRRAWLSVYSSLLNSHTLALASCKQEKIWSRFNHIVSVLLSTDCNRYSSMVQELLKMQLDFWLLTKEYE